MEKSNDLFEKLESLSEEISILKKENDRIESENEDLKFIMREVEAKKNYSFPVETLYDEMKFNLLLEAYENMSLDLLEDKLKK